jgi:hypothetical protein
VFEKIASFGHGVLFSKAKILASFKSVGMAASVTDDSFPFQGRPWPFRKGVSHKKIPPDLAVTGNLGFAPGNPWESPKNMLNP